MTAKDAKKTLDFCVDHTPPAIFGDAAFFGVLTGTELTVTRQAWGAADEEVLVKEAALAAAEIEAEYQDHRERYVLVTIKNGEQAESHGVINFAAKFVKVFKDVAQVMVYDDVSLVPAHAADAKEQAAYTMPFDSDVFLDEKADYTTKQKDVVAVALYDAVEVALDLTVKAIPRNTATFATAGVANKLEAVAITIGKGAWSSESRYQVEDAGKHHTLGVYGQFLKPEYGPVEFDLTGLAQLSKPGVTGITLGAAAGQCALQYTDSATSYVQMCSYEGMASGSSDGLSAGAIAGIVIAVVVVVAAVVALLYFFVFKKK